MVTLFVNTFMASYCEHMMGSSAKQFINVIAIAKCIEQEIRSGKIFIPTEKKGFKENKKDINHIEGAYKSKKN